MRRAHSYAGPRAACSQSSGSLAKRLTVLLITALASAPGAAASPPILPYGLWVMDADGTNPRRLVRYTSHDSRPPDWSPDGARLAAEKNQQIAVVDVATETRTVITETGSNWDPTWSPDGTQVAFVSARDGARTDIYTVASDESREERLTSDPRRDESPEWSPDGKTIAFMRYGKGGGLFTVDVANQRETKLVGGVYGDIAWSPDGERLLFESAHDVWVVSRDGSGVANLTHSDRWEMDPTWSPNGTEVAYCAGSSIFVMVADGSARDRIIRETDCLYGVSWSSDGTSLAVSKDGDLWSVQADGSRARRIARTRPGEVSPAWSPTGDHIAYLRK